MNRLFPIQWEQPVSLPLQDDLGMLTKPKREFLTG